MATPGREVLVLVLSLLLRNVEEVPGIQLRCQRVNEESYLNTKNHCSCRVSQCHVHNQFAIDDVFTVDRAVDHNATLPCSITITINWKDEQLQVIWFRNFTEKLWDCVMESKKAPHCQLSPNSSRTQISWKLFGKADLEISSLQESDEGQYQCWIILSDAYYRKDIFLRVHGVHSNGRGKNTSIRWLRLAETVSPWTIFLFSGWPIAIFLAGLLLTKGLCVRKRKYQLRNLI